MSGEGYKWWLSSEMFTAGSGEPFLWLKKAYFTYACKEKKTVHFVTVRGLFDDYTTLGKICTGHGFNCVFNHINDEDGDFCRYQLYVREEGHIEITERSINSNYFIVSIALVDIKLALDIVKEIQPHSKPHDFRQVKMLATGSSGNYTLMDVGSVNSPLIRTNYTKDILEGFDFLVKESTVKSPTGRIALLDGAPGTGKSFFIRGFITEAKGFFVIVPSSLIGSLSGPDLLPCLLNYRYEANGPITLILEDADAGLIKRESGNHNQLSDLLNMGDGLLGELADLRIIATTNTKKIDLDPAVTRPGRLSKHLHFKPLGANHLEIVYKILTGKEKTFRGARTLAEVYRLAIGDGWSPADQESGLGTYI